MAKKIELVQTRVMIGDLLEGITKLMQQGYLGTDSVILWCKNVEESSDAIWNNFVPGTLLFGIETADGIRGTLKIEPKQASRFLN